MMAGRQVGRHAQQTKLDTFAKHRDQATQVLPGPTELPEEAESQTTENPSLADIMKTI